MRKWFYAGAVVGGFLLLGAAPAQADVVPAPAGGLLSPLGGGSGNPGLGLDPAGGLNLQNPLGGAPMMDVQPGRNSADLSGPATDALSEPAGRRPAAGSAPAELPLLGGLTGGDSSGGGASGANLGGAFYGGGASGAGLGGAFSGGGASGAGLGGAFSGGGASGAGLGGAGQPGGGLGTLVPADLLGGGLLGNGLLGGGLTPDGRPAAAWAPRESALFEGGVPLLGGLGGLLPANETPRTLPATGDDTPAGMPAGGTPVDPALIDPALIDPAPADPALIDPAPAGTKADEPVDDPRLHEEPIDDEDGGKRRSFSDSGRPVAGEDQDFR
ncbi:hypothetical protein [Actinoplanes sp. NPDC049599]|uniref:hypothetical protein n=1 Tax=Actinoplanes sp. NPDC049599 TaxID=3363903 RepID=UPI00378F3C91